MLAEHSNHESSVYSARARSRGPARLDIRPARSAAPDSAKALDPACALLAHEPRGRLSVLSTNIEAIRARLEAMPGTAESWLSDALTMQQRAGSRLQQLLNILLEAFRLESGPRDLQRESFDLCDLLRDVLRMQADGLRSSGCSCSLVTDGPVTGAWDRVRIKLAISNLVDNARKYGRGRPIEATVGGDDAWAWLRVRDHGVGIDWTDSQRIYEPFVRVRTKPAVSGFGLGLWLVRAIADAHGGSVTLTSKLGDGATFELRLPRIAENS